MAAKPCVLLTGGAGYIGIHTAVQLVESGRYRVLIADNLSNTSTKAVDALRKNVATPEDVEFLEVDIATDKEKLMSANFDCVIHFAALKAVGESVEQPLRYYRNNLDGLLTVLEVCQAKNVKHFVFSSSATVYRPCEKLLTEESPLGASNPYGHTKVFCEQILQDLFKADNSWRISLLRYFNPIGAHPSGQMGESPAVPMNILPIIQKVAIGKLDQVSVCGNDWATPDGTGVRDYIHVMDLADGHLLALNRLYSSAAPSNSDSKSKSNSNTNNSAEGMLDIYNLGTGKGVSVLEMIKTFESETGRTIKYSVVGRRAGDLATVCADPSKAERELGFKATRSVADACASAWKWQSANPDGYLTA